MMCLYSRYFFFLCRVNSNFESHLSLHGQEFTLPHLAFSPVHQVGLNPVGQINFAHEIIRADLNRARSTLKRALEKTLMSVRVRLPTIIAFKLPNVVNSL